MNGTQENSGGEGNTKKDREGVRERKKGRKRGRGRRGKLKGRR